MNVLDQPRVKASGGVGLAESYEVRASDGTWDVVQIEQGVWIAAPPRKTGQHNETDSSYRRWVDSLPRYASAEHAIATVPA